MTQWRNRYLILFFIYIAVVFYLKSPSCGWVPPQQTDHFHLTIKMQSWPSTSFGRFFLPKWEMGKQRWHRLGAQGTYCTEGWPLTCPAATRGTASYWQTGRRQPPAARHQGSLDTAATTPQRNSSYPVLSNYGSVSDFIKFLPEKAPLTRSPKLRNIFLGRKKNADHPPLLSLIP